MNKRIYVRKKDGFRGKEQALVEQFKADLGLNNLVSIQKYNVYDIFNINQQTLSLASQQVFSEIVTDQVYTEMDLTNKIYLCIETLPNQFDMRSSSAIECLRLINPASNASCQSAELLVFTGIDKVDVQRIADYYINPIECRQKDLSKLEIEEVDRDLSEELISGFIKMDAQELKRSYEQHSFSFSIENYRYIQEHYQSLNRDPLLGELLIIDTYWSDHCRHTTFNTELENIQINDEQVKAEFQQYMNLKAEINDQKPVSLMNLGTIYGKYAKKKGLLTNLEDTSEDNAISLEVKEDDETYLLQFKNETHNHPTEIEPFGGASTCIGGAIRDPLSGRAYVYQGMRISGGSSILEAIEDTLENKLPQKVISQKACDGFSSYGNQIGLATSYVRELYHPGYQAKHLEAGAVIGAVNKKHVTRMEPEVGDIVVLIGGATGFDGIGGATGSSKSHTNDSLANSAVEVQKGNAPVERKIQRLFLNPAALKLIKKANDFGAGGVSVAIGELSDSIEIYLDRVPLKAANLKASEIALSESQERMALVISPDDYQLFKEYAQMENLIATKVATVTDSNHLVMKYYNDIVIDIDRDFLNSSGVTNKQNVSVTKQEYVPCQYPEKLEELFSDERLVDNINMDKRFDSTVGALTVLMPYGGEYQLTKNQVSVAKIPETKELVSMMAYGFNPQLTDDNPYFGAMSAVIDSVTKLVASGAKLADINLSFQEYFRRLNDKPENYGIVLSTLLGALRVQRELNTPALGGKDSMSGTFNDINVPATLISFAFAPGNVNQVISTEFKTAAQNIYILESNLINGEYDFAQIKQNYAQYETYVQKGQVTSGFAITDGGLALNVVKALMGNKLGCQIDYQGAINQDMYGSIIFASEAELDCQKIGVTTNDRIVKINDQSSTIEALINLNNNLFAQTFAANNEREIKKELATCNETYDYQAQYTDKPRVFIPVFSGTNSEIEMSRAFADEGCELDVWVFKNYSEEATIKSIKEMKEHIQKADIIAISGGFSGGDEPDGSGKYIVNILANETIKAAIEEHLAANKLILGICNGFQALIKSGLISSSKVEFNAENPTLFHNECAYHLSQMVKTKVKSQKSPWLSNLQLDSEYTQVISHGEGRLVASEESLKQLIDNGQIAFTYAGTNPNNSTANIEGLISPCGKILGKMAHSERYVDGLYQNIPGEKRLNIFKNAVEYFKNGER